MKTSDFSYNLPQGLIAQKPASPRDSSRLLVLNRESGGLDHILFRDIHKYLNKNDLLVMNNTKVYPARLYVHKKTGAAIEMLFIERFNSSVWRVIAKGVKKLKKGTEVVPDNNESTLLSVKEKKQDGSLIVELRKPENGSIDSLLEKYGRVPLPPYIRREANDKDRDTYQTVYASQKGAVAAPTAGLHFTPRLIKTLTGARIRQAFVTLHVGLGTFRPVKEENPEDHLMHKERFEISAESIEMIKQTKKNRGRVIAVGTTTVRVLEVCANEKGELYPCSGETGIFILPGYKFRVIDGLITNFHLPRSTLLMLVSAFAGRENILKAYNKAVENKYRFYSYGDAMFIL